MKHRLLAAACGAALSFAYSAEAQQPPQSAIPMLPPTPIGSTSVCPSGTRQLLSYSGTIAGGPQGGINCVPITTDAQGDLATNGYLQVGNSPAPCDGNHVGAIRYNTTSFVFEGCNGVSWQGVGGGVTLVVGGCQTYWSGCPTGYRATS